MNNKKISIFFIFLTAAMFCGSCSTSTMTDKDGKKYKTIKIGEQIWMAENLNYETSSGSWCYDDDPINCEKYGRLYNWETAMSVCPEGWRLPSKSDFDELLKKVGGNSSSSFNGLVDGGSSGFNALLGGWVYYYIDFYVICNDSIKKASYAVDFYDIDTNGRWWSSTEVEGSSGAYSLNLNVNYASVGSGHRVVLGSSVRCLLVLN